MFLSIIYNTRKRLFDAVNVFAHNYRTMKKKETIKQTNVSACNRTLYGDVGRTYRVEIRRPREDRLPFLCHLNFTAAGSDLGDLVQVGHRNDVVVENNADWCPAGVRVCHGPDSGPTRRVATVPG